MKSIKTTKAKTPPPKAPVKASPAASLSAPPATKRTAKVTAKASPVTPLAARATVPLVAPRRELTPDLIAARAYIIWEKQGRPHGQELANWLLAERQLKAEIQSFTA